MTYYFSFFSMIYQIIKKLVATGIEPMTYYFSFFSMIYSTYVSHLNLIQMFMFYATDVV